MIKKLILPILILISVSEYSKIYAQKCAKKTYCSKEQLGDFDYRSQSHYAELSNGESQKVEIVVYANQSYRMLICSDPKLGNVAYKVSSITKRPKRVVQSISQKEVTLYRKTEGGDFDYDENGNKIIEGKKMLNDTVWQRRTVEEETVIFDSESMSFKPPYWEKETKKTGMLVIETKVEDSDDPRTGCVNILVGRKTSVFKSKR